MACGGNGMSDERIGEALIKEVIEEELKDVSSEVPPLTPLSVKVQTEQEQKVVNQLSKMIRIIGDRVQGDQEFQEWGGTGPGSRWDRFKEVAHKVFEHGITWERIAVLFYVAGRLAVKRSCCATGQQDRDAPSALANGPYTPWRTRLADPPSHPASALPDWLRAANTPW
ncbi:hypothetical protein INR49_001022, partial [Caranx melampygus]